MMESIEEFIEVLVHFRKGSILPFRFRWNSTVFKIAKITGSWEDREGQYRRCHFSIVTEAGDFFELRFHVKDFSWVLSKASVEA